MSVADHKGKAFHAFNKPTVRSDSALSAYSSFIESGGHGPNFNINMNFAAGKDKDGGK